MKRTPRTSRPSTRTTRPSVRSQRARAASSASMHARSTRTTSQSRTHNHKTSPSKIATNPVHKRLPHAANEFLSARDRIEIPGTHVSLSRRQFLASGAALVVVAGAAGVAQLINAHKKQASAVDALNLKEGSVALLSDGSYGTQPTEVALSETFETKLPYRTIVHAGASRYATCLLPNQTPGLLRSVSLMSLSDGTLTEVLAKPVSKEHGFDICTARCTDAGLVWIEASSYSGEWRVYQAALNGTSLQTPILVEHGEKDHEPAFIAAVADRAFWQTVPKAQTPAAKEGSFVRSCTFGSDSIRDDWHAQGQMATPLYAADTSVCFTARTKNNSSHYEIVSLDAKSGNVLHNLVLPAGVKPLEAGCSQGMFSFCLDAAYKEQGGLASIGTYICTGEKPLSDSWFCFDRVPCIAPAWIGNFCMVKSTRTVSGIDTSGHTYFSLPCPDGGDKYGDFLASSGVVDRLVTYLSMPDSPDGKTKAHTLVRVWKI